MERSAPAKLIRHLDQVPDQLRGGAVAIGNFDGVHLGHAAIVGELVAQARRLGCPAVVLCFDPTPARILRPNEAPAPLTTTSRKAELLGSLGVDTVVAHPADEIFVRLSAAEFFFGALCRCLAPRAIVEGPNFFFGHNRQGDIALLRKLCAEASIILQVVEPVLLDGQMISSSRIRALIAEGRVEEGRRMMTAPYRLSGRVVRGAGRGAQLGFPTANLGNIETLLPAEGIYAGRAPVDGRLLPAAISLGPNPTFGEQRLKAEVYLVGFSGSLYGRQLEVDFLARLREIRRFDSVGALLAQMKRDVATAEAMAAHTTP